MAVSGFSIIAIIAFIGSSYGPVTLASATVATPIEKCMELLTKIDKDIEEEGKQEAIEYDKYACFCKDSTTTKKLDIEKATTKLAKLDADIDVLQKEIDDLTTAITDLEGSISDTENAKKDAKVVRDAAHASFLVEEANLTASMSSIDSAVKALQDSKGQMQGAKLGLTAIKDLGALADQMLLHHNAETMTPQHRAMLAEASALLQTAARGKQVPVLKYKYSGNTVISLLESLKRTCVKNLQALRVDEFKDNAQWEKEDAARARDIKFSTAAKEKKEQVQSEKTQEKDELEKDRIEVQKNKQLDEDFLADLVTDCEAKGAAWDDRSTKRAAERTALSQALTVLKEQIAPNAGALTKLTFLQEGATVTHAKAPRSTPSVLQVVHRRGQLTDAQKQETAMAKARAFLLKSSNTLKSSTLVAAYARISSTPDRFVKVRSMIKDLVARLEEEAQDEDTHKTKCDEYQGITDNTYSIIEEKNTLKAKKTSEIATLAADIKDLAAEISTAQKELMEATELNLAMIKQTDANVQMCTEGYDGVVLALDVLNGYYNLLQTKTKASSSAPGGTLAADPFDGATGYAKKEGASKSIVGLLEVIQADFERQKDAAIAYKGTEQAAYDDKKEKLEEAISTKEGDKGTKEGEVVGLKDDLETVENDLVAQKALHEGKVKELEAFRKDCQTPTDHKADYANRVAAREKEIKALQSAYDIMASWDK